MQTLHSNEDTLAVISYILIPTKILLHYYDNCESTLPKNNIHGCGESKFTIFFLSTYFLMRSLESDFMSPHTRTHIQSVVKHILCSYVLSLTLAHTHTFLPRTFGFFRSQHITVQKNINRIVNWKKKKKKKENVHRQNCWYYSGRYICILVWRTT